MSNAPKKKVAFNYSAQHVNSPLKNVKTKWNLKKLYYTSENDSRLEKDVQAAEQAYSKFAKKWRSKNFTEQPLTLALALKELETLSGNSDFSRPGRYFSFRNALDAKDSVAEKRIALLTKRMRNASNQILFFHLTLAAVSKKHQSTLLNHEVLKPYRYFLGKVFLNSKYNLSEAEEKIIRLKGPQSYGMWVDAVEKIVSSRTISWKGKQFPIPEALETLDLLTSADKKAMWELIIVQMEQIGEVAEHEFNAIITDVRGEDDLRGYKKPYSATALGYEDTELSIENLVKAVSIEGFALSQKFYKLKAKHHDVKQLHYTEKYASIGPDLEIPFVQALEIARDVFYGVKPLYGEIFDRLFTNGQVDVFPRVGKRGGAFMSSSYGNPTHVLLNHVSNFKSLETLAHEMGHAVHAERAQLNRPLYAGYSTVIAETASTLFENLLFDAVYEQTKSELKLSLLHDRITRDISTIQRQIAFFNAELEIHNTIHTEGAATNVELANIMYKHLKSYLGPAVSLNPRDGYSYVYIPHLRYGFYVYSYACGILMSNIMASRYKKDNRYADVIDNFFCAGDSASVADIYKIAEINTNKRNTFTEALKVQAEDIETFRKFVNKTKK